jgi:hypothetical protein
MLIRFQVGGDASPYTIAEYLKAIRDEAVEAAGAKGAAGAVLLAGPRRPPTVTAETKTRLADANREQLVATSACCEPTGPCRASTAFGGTRRE